MIVRKEGKKIFQVDVVCPECQAELTVNTDDCNMNVGRPGNWYCDEIPLVVCPCCQTNLAISDAPQPFKDAVYRKVWKGVRAYYDAHPHEVD